MVKKTKSEFLKQEAESFPESKFEKKFGRHNRYQAGVS